MYGVLRLFELLSKRVGLMTRILLLGWTPLLGNSLYSGNILKKDHPIALAMGTSVEVKP